MWRSVFSVFVLLVNFFSVFGQESKHYRVDENENVEAVSFTLTATSGTCTIKPTKSKHPVNIFGNPLADGVTPVFDTWMEGGIQEVNFAIKQDEPIGIGTKLSYSVFNNESKVEENQWFVYLSEFTPMFLNLNYGFGEADVDLSDTMIKQLKINTGSADVQVRYSPGKMNKIEMDTFMVSVDMGSLNVKRVNLSKAKVIIAEVGFGSLRLDLSEKSVMRSHISASVGAGNLVIAVPKTNTPIVVYIDNSPLCHILFDKSFRQIQPNVYANESYNESAKNLLTFDLDVALGKISFVTE